MSEAGKKIFNLSLHRSATKSFSRFLQAHGFRSAHWPGPSFDLDCADAVPELDTRLVFERSRRFIDENDACADVPFSFLGRELAHYYPDALFVIVVRSVPSWIRSVRRHIGDRELDNLEKMQYWLNTDLRESFISRYDDAQLGAIYAKHLVTTIDLMQQVGASFKLFTLDETSLDQNKLAADMSKYLGFEAKAPFPAINLRFRKDLVRSRVEAGSDRNRRCIRPAP